MNRILKASLQTALAAMVFSLTFVATAPRSVTAQVLGSGYNAVINSIKLAKTTNQIITGASTNLTTLNFPASSGAVTVTMPNTTDTVVTLAATQSLTGKSFGTGGVGFTNATSGTVTMSPPTGALGTPTLTLPVITGSLASSFDCGSTGSGSQTCSPSAVGGIFHSYSGRSTLSSNAATITFPATFTSSSTFNCVANDITTRANPVQMVPASGTTATITNTTGASDVIQWFCQGN